MSASRILFVVVVLAACRPRSNTPLDACDRGTSLEEFHRCVNRQTEMLDQQLVVVLDSAKQRSPDASAVESSQSAWVRYRKAQSEAEGATAKPAEAPYGWLSLTQSRIDELRGMYR